LFAAVEHDEHIVELVQVAQSVIVVEQASQLSGLAAELTARVLELQVRQVFKSE
jgi:pyruvate/2-oxoglutarate/acetoin dehydrogenase E1 component